MGFIYVELEEGESDDLGYQTEEAIANMGGTVRGENSSDEEEDNNQTKDDGEDGKVMEMLGWLTLSVIWFMGLTCGY